MASNPLLSFEAELSSVQRYVLCGLACCPLFRPTELGTRGQAGLAAAQLFCRCATLYTAVRYGLGARIAAPSCWKTPAAVGGHLCTRERHRLHQPWQGAGDVPRRLPFFNEIHAAGQIKQMAPQCWLHLRLCAVLRQLDWRESALADLLAPQKSCSNAKCSLWIAPIVASTLVPSLADVP